MKDILGGLPSAVAQQVHPDWKRNERSYWAKRESLRRQYEGQWIAFAGGAVVAAGSSPVHVLHAAQRTGTHPLVTCVGREDTAQRMRRSTHRYHLSYPGEPLPRAPVVFRPAAGAPGRTFEDTIPDVGADASALPWTDCQALRLDLEAGVPGLMGGVGGSSTSSMVWAAYAVIDGTEYPCWLQADFQGRERIVGRDVLNQLDICFAGRPVRLCSTRRLRPCRTSGVLFPPGCWHLDSVPHSTIHRRQRSVRPWPPRRTSPSASSRKPSAGPRPSPRGKVPRSAA